MREETSSHLHHAVGKTCVSSIFQADQAGGDSANQTARGHHELVARFGCHAQGCNVFLGDSSGGTWRGGGEGAREAVHDVGAEANADRMADGGCAVLAHVLEARHVAAREAKLDVVGVGVAATGRRRSRAATPRAIARAVRCFRRIVGCSAGVAGQTCGRCALQRAGGARCTTYGGVVNQSRTKTAAFGFCAIETYAHLQHHTQQAEPRPWVTEGYGGKFLRRKKAALAASRLGALQRTASRRTGGGRGRDCNSIAGASGSLKPFRT